MRALALCLPLTLLVACQAPGPEGLARAKPAAVTVKWDIFHKPLPEIPLPNDIATRFDATSPTGRRVNASLIAPTLLEQRVRRLADQLDGWGSFQPITIPFSGPIDVRSVIRGHRDVDYAEANDVIYLVNVDRKSKSFGKIHHLDVGNGNYPVILENRNYWENDPRGFTLSLAFEEANEDVNANGLLDEGEDENGNGALDPGEDRDGDGVLDPPEDTDADGVLDFPNYLPDAAPRFDDHAARADALMTFYERETNTLIVRPLMPLEERTTYAVVVTRRILDVAGQPVGSPFEWVNHTAQTKALEGLADVLPDGLTLDDVAFAFTYTTQSVATDWVAIRDGLYGHGVQAKLGADFPAEVDTLEPLVDPSVFQGLANTKILRTEDLIDELEQLADEAVGIDRDTENFRILTDSQAYVDYHVVGSFLSPQLFDRTAPDGTPLPLDEQSWPNDLARTPATARPERVYFWLTVPRKEISARGAGQPAPVVIAGHGYGSSRFEMLFFAGYFARQGLATISIDCVSHGLEIHPIQQALIEGQFKEAGLEPFIQAAFKSRVFDQNADGRPDSAADFWTSFVFHTRDMVRQSALDYMQLARILRSFDGARTWRHDVNGDGMPELAGDFDADGVIDVGGDAMIGMTGGSLGGIMSMVVGALEPEVSVVVPIAGGGGLMDIGVRSLQGGVREAVQLRLMTPLYTGTLDRATGVLELATIVPDLTSTARLVLGRVEGVKPGDTMVVDNLINGKRGCGYVDAEGRVRTSVESDLGDRTRITLFHGPALAGRGDEHCELKTGATPYATFDALEETIDFQGTLHEPGEPLAAFAEGMGLRRASPSLRRFLGIAQLVLDPADPAVLARHLSNERLTYPGTGQTTGAHAMIVTTVGDMNVPASSGVTVGRAAGLIDYRTNDPRYGKPANQEVLDTYTAEAVNTLKRFVNRDGNGVHLDVENFSEGTDMWGDTVPRHPTPLRLWGRDALGGVSGAIFPYAVPTGQHGFAFPGEMTDDARRRCRDTCPAGQDCGCATLATYDVGQFMFNMLGRYFASGGTELVADLCGSRDDCTWRQEPPPAREATPKN